MGYNFPQIKSAKWIPNHRQLPVKLNTPGVQWQIPTVMEILIYPLKPFEIS